MSIYKNIYYKIESVRLWYFFDDGSYIELVSKELNYLVAILYVYAGGFDFYEVKKNPFSKRKWKYYCTFNHFPCEKSSKRAKSTNHGV